MQNHRRKCACHAGACKRPFKQGDLRVHRVAGDRAHRKYFHPSCVEGGLGPFDAVVGSANLEPAQEEELRQHCDRPNHPTRAEHLTELRARRLRRRTVGPATATTTATGDSRPTEDDDLDEYAPSPDPNADSGAAAETLHNLEWWDTVDYDALGVDVRTVGQVPAELSHSLALLRGAAATAFLAAHDAGDGLARARAGKLLTFFDRALLFKPAKVRGGRNPQEQRRPVPGPYAQDPPCLAG